MHSGMAKGSLLTLRVDAALKERLAAAASRNGKSITAFVLEATMIRVEAVERTPESKRARLLRGACPSFFRALCMTASAGGASDYSTAGHELTRHVQSLGPDDLDDDEWKGRVGDLRRLLRRRGKDSEIAEWFEHNLPRCMDLVPARRRHKFVDGVRAYYGEYGL